jgi:hypothetical protein
VIDSFRLSISLAAFSLAMVPGSLLVAPTCQAQQTRDSYTVTGVVKNSITGQPVARTLVDGQTDAALTDNEGHFELHLSQRFTQLQVRRPGYTSGERNGFHSLSLSAETTNLTLYLTPTASITGHVVTENRGDPPDVSFTAYKRRQVRGHERWLVAANAATDSEGVVRMYEMEAPATYVLCSRPFREQGFAPEPGKPIFGYPAQCFPAGPAEGSDGLNLSAGQQAEFEIPLTRQRFYPVTIATPNHPQGQVGIQIRYSNGLETDQGFRWNQQTSTWEAELPNGSYYAEGRSQCGKTTCYGRVDFKVANTGLQGLSLAVVPLAPVPVAVHKDFTDKVAHETTFTSIATGRRTIAIEGILLELLPADDVTGITNNWGARPLRRPEGSDSDLLEIEGVTPGRYWVQASFHEGYVSAITSGGVDLTKDPLVVGAGNSTTPIEITLRNDGGEINCAVVGTSGGVQVYAIPMGPHITRIQNWGGGMDGQVRISNLAPGTYSVIALDGFSDLNSMDTRELNRLAEKGKTVTVTAGGTVNVQIGVTQTSAEEQNQ